MDIDIKYKIDFYFNITRRLKNWTTLIPIQIIQTYIEYFFPKLWNMKDEVWGSFTMMEVFK